ncbi:hypothetical protein D8674_008882 [Pyrus ussuriensis x Pyrus communis]|uniref:HAT C-terminal dimerisation domain-containing protein n=1 Tax=Pyrus ussuriensis x Pyrus communis TaxID=2448454 RepID=A0A5N5HX37_9ROSA|nr:hypothetical protein D8674_008882 [Pyrus ussuriensis x Pyrus communis]
MDLSNGLKPIQSDFDAQSMCNFIPKDKVIEMYIEELMIEEAVTQEQQFLKSMELLASKFQSANMSRFEESSKHSWVALFLIGDSPEKPEDEAIEIDPENEENVEGDPKNDGNESEGRKMVGPPTKEDWFKAEAFVKILWVFYDVTLRVNASTHPMVHTGLHDVIKIKTAINNLESRVNMQVGLPSEQLLKAMASNMRSKYFKKKLSNFEAQLKANEVKDLLHALYDTYAPNVEGGKHMKKVLSQAQYYSTSFDVVSMEDDLVYEWMHFVEDSDEKVVRDKVDSYLLDPLVQITKEEFTKYFNILLWWKMNGSKYPILAVIAKDILAIQVSIVASESAFSTRGRVISDFRSSLTPKSVEALICMQNWLSGENIITLEDDAPLVEHIEFYESIESELAKSTSTLASLTLNPQSQQAPSQSKSSILASQAHLQVQRPPKPSASKCAKGKGKAKV